MKESTNSEKPLPSFAIFGIALYLFCYISVAIWGYYVVNGVAMTISFLIVYYYLDLIIDKNNFFEKFKLQKAKCIFSSFYL